MSTLEGKVALITAAASGIGAATARALARAGATVVLTDIADAAGQALADELDAPARFAHLDVTDPDAWQSVIADVEDRHGRLDVLVHNAGGGVAKSIEEVTLKQWRFVQALNVESVLLGTQAALPLMRASGEGGSIVIVSSVAGLIGTPDLAAYNAAKGAVRMMAKTIALHCARKGDKIRCNSVHPGFTDTPMVAGLIAAAKDPELARRRIETTAPLGRLATADEVASLIEYLAGDRAAFITGAELTVDGGLTAT